MMKKKLSAKGLLYTIGGIVIVTLSGIVGLYTGIIISRPDAPNLDDPQSWLPIKVFRGALDPHSGKVDVSVSAIYRLSDDKYPHTVMQNLIEIKTAERTFKFMWPDAETYVAGWCDILDVDGDGIKEFLLYSGTGSLRIVSFAGDEFQFRRRLDDLLSFEYDVGPFDLDGDGSLEFVEDERFPSDLDTKGVRIPRVKRWSRVGGFIDVSKEYPRYYKERVIPELERRLAGEQDSELRQTISRAIEFIKRERL